jgi:hypothetical protein
MPAQQGTVFSWTGEHKFLVSGGRRHEDTLYIETSPGKGEELLQLRLPTLCITYADMAFANAIGGAQVKYPSSRSYGPRHFDPPVKVKGSGAVEKLTWIRGAEQVEIGPEATNIAWYRGKPLVIPRLRIEFGESVPAALGGSKVPIPVQQPLIVDVAHLMDGRPVGGLRFEVRHPQWIAPPEPTLYDLCVKVIDGETRDPLPEVRVNFLRWSTQQSTPNGQEGFERLEQRYTDGSGYIHLPHRPCGALEAITLDLPGWRAVARCYRALPGQPVRVLLTAWKLRVDMVRYTWSASDTLEQLAALCGHEPEEILAINRLSSPSALSAGMTIKLPCYAAAYRLEEGDSLDWLAKEFGYGDAQHLGVVNGVSDPAYMDAGLDIPLPGWRFFYARPGDSLGRFDAMFGLPAGASRAVGRVYRPNPCVPIDAETIAIPNKGFVATQIQGIQP